MCPSLWFCRRVFLSCFDVFAKFVEPRTEILGVAVIDESPIAWMRRADPKRTFYGTPILLRAAGRFPGVGDNPVCIAALRAVQLLDAIKVGQTVAVDDYVL